MRSTTGLISSTRNSQSSRGNLTDRNGAALQHSRQRYRRALIRQAFADQPFLDDVGDLHIVLVLHQHVSIALDADLGKVDPVDRTSRSLDRVGILGVDLFERRPAW